MWAVSQATPVRRMIINGNLVLPGLLLQTATSQ